jgi:hypothetical protein
MATIITVENMPAVLAQIVERLDEQDARIEALATHDADREINLDELREQQRVQSVATRAAVTQLATDIREIAKDQNRNGNPGHRTGGKGNSGTEPQRRANAATDRRSRQEETEAETEAVKKAAPPHEPEPPARKRAHRWT